MHLIGVVHLQALPGDAHFAGDVDAVFDAAKADALALAQGGADAVIVENFGSAPFNKGNLDDPAPPHQVAALTKAALMVRAETGLSLGINCLRNDAQAALGIAAVTGAEFIRVNVHAGTYVTDQGIIEGQAAHTLAYRTRLGRSIEIWADVLVKHAQPLAPLDPVQAVDEVQKRGGAHAVIVTGSQTGSPIDRGLVERLATERPEARIVLGSGVTPDNVASLSPFAYAAIVGTWLKEDGKLDRPIDPERVKILKEAFAQYE